MRAAHLRAPLRARLYNILNEKNRRHHSKQAHQQCSILQPKYVCTCSPGESKIIDENISFEEISETDGP